MKSSLLSTAIYIYVNRINLIMNEFRPFEAFDKHPQTTKMNNVSRRGGTISLRTPIRVSLIRV